jgi:hypothetical protein
LPGPDTGLHPYDNCYEARSRFTPVTTRGAACARTNPAALGHPPAQPEGQYADYDGGFGMSHAEFSAAMGRASDQATFPGGIGGQASIGILARGCTLDAGAGQ